MPIKNAIQRLFLMLLLLLMLSFWAPILAKAEDKLPAPTGFTYVGYVARDDGADGYESYSFQWNPVEGAQGYSISWEAVDDEYDYGGEYIIGGNSTSGSISSNHNVYASGNWGPGHRLTIGKKYIVKVRAWTRTDSLASHIGNTYNYNYTYGEYSDPVYVVAGVEPASEDESTVPPADSEKILSDSTENSLVIGTLTYKIENKQATVTAPQRKSSTKLTIPATVKVEGKTVPVTTIAPNAFKGMKKLKAVTIGKNIKKIGKNAFRNCKKLKTITIKTSKLTSGKVGSNAFKGIYSKAKIKVPKKKLSAYKKLLKKKGIGKKAKITK